MSFPQTTNPNFGGRISVVGGIPVRHLRQQDAVDMGRLSELQITLIGAGSIGSVTAVWLGKMGITNLAIYDDDIIQEHNWSNQMFTTSDIGRPKGEALWDVMESFCSFTPRVVLQAYTDQPLTEVVICAMDIVCVIPQSHLAVCSPEIAGWTVY